MRILIIGNGAREHALAWHVARHPATERVYVAPGNAGTANEAKVENVPIDALEFTALAEFAKLQKITLTIVGPEAPLVAGIRDVFDAHGLDCFGPSQAAAQLEGSKAFTKDFMQRHGIPSAESETFTELAAAERYIRTQCEAHGVPIVIKADGLAAGKGVVVARSVDEAVAAAREMLTGTAFGRSGERIVVEEFLDGEEASFICICDGRLALPLASSQDHKPRDDGDRGPNTGGLGAYSPAPVVTAEVHRRIVDEVIEPTLNGMATEGMPYQGFLYAGLMIMADGSPKVIEFNCRFGDPECEPILTRLQSSLVEVCQRALAGRLAGVQLAWDSRAALGVVMAAGGYPLDYAKGDVIEGLDRIDDPDVKVFHAGTRFADGRVVTSGGRVLCVVGLGESVAAAQQRTYAAVDRIRWPNAYCRRDIGYRAIAREQTGA